MTITLQVSNLNSAPVELITGLSYEEATQIMRRIAYVNNVEIEAGDTICLEGYFEVDLTQYDVTVSLDDFDIDKTGAENPPRVASAILSLAYDEDHKIISAKKYYSSNSLIAITNFDCDICVDSYEQGGLIYEESCVSYSVYTATPTIADLMKETIYTVIENKFKMQSYSDFELFRKRINQFSFRTDIFTMLDLGINEIRYKNNLVVYVTHDYGNCANIIESIFEASKVSDDETIIY